MKKKSPKKKPKPKAKVPVVPFATGYPPIVERSWAAWEALRKLGYSADDIYVMTANEDMIFVHLEAPGGKEFDIEIGHLGKMTEAQFRALWTRFAGEINAEKWPWDKGLESIFWQWLGEVGGGTMLVFAIKNKGIALPREHVDFGEKVIH